MNLSNIRIVLVGPLYGGNVGSVCRAMGNMGLEDLVLVAPRNLDMEHARMMACHAQPILEGQREVPDLGAALADCGRAYGTSARKGLYRQHARTPRASAPLILEASAAGRVALVFGREDKGLSNEELALCTDIIQIPTTAAYESINLAQAVMICAYELYAAAGVYEGPEEKSPEAPSEMRERMCDIWREMLLETGFMLPDKADHMMMGVRRIFGRGVRTLDDCHIMMGVARQAQWAAGASTEEGPSHAPEG